MDLNLLISVTGGLGRYEAAQDGQQVYCKDDDCLGTRPASNEASDTHVSSAAIFTCRI
jgi:hypothetical protein